MAEPTAGAHALESTQRLILTALGGAAPSSSEPTAGAHALESTQASILELLSNPEDVSDAIAAYITSTGMDRDQVLIEQPLWWGASSASSTYRTLLVYSAACGGDKWLIQDLRSSLLASGGTNRSYRLQCVYLTDFVAGAIFDADSPGGASGNRGAITNTGGAWTRLPAADDGGTHFGNGLTVLYSNQAKRILELNLPTGTTEAWLLMAPRVNTGTRTITIGTSGDTANPGVLDLSNPVNMVADGTTCPWDDMYVSTAHSPELTDFVRVATWAGTGSPAGTKLTVNATGDYDTLFVGGIAVGATASDPASGVPDLGGMEAMTYYGPSQGYILCLGDGVATGTLWGFGHMSETADNYLSSNVTTFGQTLEYDLTNETFTPTANERMTQVADRFAVTITGTLTISDDGEVDIGDHCERWTFLPGGHICAGLNTINAAGADYVLSASYNGGYLGLTEPVADAAEWYQVPSYFGAVRTPVLADGGWDDTSTTPLRAQAVVMGGSLGEVLTVSQSFQAGTAFSIKRMSASEGPKLYQKLGTDAAGDGGSDLALTNGMRIWGTTQRMFGIPGSLGYYAFP